MRGLEVHSVVRVMANASVSRSHRPVSVLPDHQTSSDISTYSVTPTDLTVCGKHVKTVIQEKTLNYILALS